MVEWHISDDISSQTVQFNWDQYYHIILCPYCDGNHHKEKCPRVEEIEYHPDQSIKRVKLREPKSVVIREFSQTTAETSWRQIPSAQSGD